MTGAATAVDRDDRRPNRAKVGETPNDLADPESQRVLAAAAVSVAYELGRQAAREIWQNVVNGQIPA